MRTLARVVKWAAVLCGIVLLGGYMLILPPSMMFDLACSKWEQIGQSAKPEAERRKPEPVRTSFTFQTMHVPQVPKEDEVEVDFADGPNAFQALIKTAATLPMGTRVTVCIKSGQLSPVYFICEAKDQTKVVVAHIEGAIEPREEMRMAQR